MEQGVAILGDHLPDLLFTKRIQGLGWKFQGGEDIRTIRSTSMDRLRSLIEGLEDGSVRFVKVSHG